MFAELSLLTLTSRWRTDAIVGLNDIREEEGLVVPL